MRILAFYKAVGKRVKKKKIKAIPNFQQFYELIYKNRMIPHKLSQKVQNDENIYINRENQKKCGSICKNSVINIKNPIILLIKIINNCTFINQCFFFFSPSFENDSTKHRFAQCINQFEFEGLTKKTQT